MNTWRETKTKMNHLPWFYRFRNSQVNFIDSLPNQNIHGKIMVKSSVREFMQTAIIFEDSSTVENTDVIIFTTEYTFSFPVFGDSENITDDQISL